MEIDHIKVESLSIYIKNLQLLDKHCHVENERGDEKILRGAIWSGSLTYGFEAKSFQQ